MSCQARRVLSRDPVPACALQEGEQSEGSFIASLMGQRNNGSLMPADSAFRMVSSVPPPLRTTSASHNSSDFNGEHLLLVRAQWQGFAPQCLVPVLAGCMCPGKYSVECE